MRKVDLVSVVIPCYNQAQYLEETVDSVIKQSYSNIEVMIVDDGSPDSTQEVALTLQEKYPEKIKIVSQENRGLSEARNSGIKKASGKYILPLDADDLIDKEMLLKCVQTLEESNADIVYADTKGFGVYNYTLKWKPFSETNPLYFTTSNATALYKKKVWEDIGGYKQNMLGGYEDWEFWINAYKHGFLFQHHSEVLFHYRTSENSMYMQTLKKEPYHRAKILLNHPEMYIYKSVQEAIETVKNGEESADYYFYSNQKEIYNEKELLSSIVNYMQTHTLESEQIVSILNKKIILSEVTVLNDSNYIKNRDADIFFFYSSLRYDIPFLHSSKYALCHNKELGLAQGTVFPFILRSLDDEYELNAYKQLTKYLETSIKQTKHDSEVRYKELAQKLNTQIEQSQAKANQAEAKANQAEVKANQAEVKVNQAELKANQAEAKVKQSEVKANQEKAKTTQAEVRAHKALQHYNMVVNSNSWKLTKPLRLVGVFLRWFIRGSKAWLTFSPVSRPRRVLNQKLISLKHRINSNPKLKMKVMRILDLSPKLKARLKRVGLVEQPIQTISKPVEEPKELSPQAKKIYTNFKKEISMQKGGK